MNPKKKTMTTTRTYSRYRVKSHMQFRLDQYPIPVIPEKDYLVRVDVCGLCRSDLHFATSWAEDWDDLGHEFGGTVVAVRDGIEGFRPGDRVAIRNAAACLACDSCVAGDFRSCRGIVVNKLGFSQYADCDSRSLVSAKGLSDAMLTLVEPTNVVLDLIYSAEIEDKHKVTIFGTGTLGLLTAHLLGSYFGVQNVHLVGRQIDEGFLADLGLTRYVSFGEPLEAPPLRDRLGGAPDRVLVTTPPSTLSNALESCGSGGRVLTVGLDRNERMLADIDIGSLIFKRARVQGVFAVPNLYFDDAVRILGQVGKPLERLVRYRIAFNDLEKSLREWDQRPHFDGKSMLELHRVSDAMRTTIEKSERSSAEEASCSR